MSSSGFPQHAPPPNRPSASGENRQSVRRLLDDCLTSVQPSMEDTEQSLTETGPAYLGAVLTFHLLDSLRGDKMLEAVVQSNRSTLERGNKWLMEDVLVRECA